MNRIDEIKERSAKADYIHQFINLNGVEVEWEDAQNAIEYLLSKLEIAEKALEELAENAQPATIIAEVALNKIRE